MAEIIEKNAQTLGDILVAAEEISCTWKSKPSDPQELWFRGQSKKRYKLLPGLYRPENAQFHYKEDSLIQRFKVRGMPFAGISMDSDWDWLFLAQHHRLVTRLLDWTEALLPGIDFALSRLMEADSRFPHDEALAQPRRLSVYDEDSPVVWMMDAGSLKAFSSRNKDEDCVYVPGGELTSKYLPSSIENEQKPENEFPLALLPSHSNVRLTAQQGVFTLHGHDTRSIDDLARWSQEYPIRLARIILDRANLDHLWRELWLTGVNRLTMFPELDSVAYITKWTGQYV